jgi:hypothetical protein
MTQSSVLLLLLMLILGLQWAGCGHSKPSYETNIGQQGTEGIPAEDNKAKEAKPIPETKDEWKPPLREGARERP